MKIHISISVLAFLAANAVPCVADKPNPRRFLRAIDGPVPGGTRRRLPAAAGAPGGGPAGGPNKGGPGGGPGGANKNAVDNSSYGLLETKPCVDWSSITEDQKSSSHTDSECASNPPSSGGCCRSYHWLRWDSTNAFPYVPCICNSATRDPTTFTPDTLPSSFKCSDENPNCNAEEAAAEEATAEEATEEESSSDEEAAVGEAEGVGEFP